MESEKNLINGPEITLEKRDRSKEYWYLNQLKSHLTFGFYKDPVLAESNFYSSIAWYIDTLQKTDWNWETKIKEFIDSIINFNGSDSEKLLYADKFLIREKQKWYKDHNMNFDMNLLESILSRIDDAYKTDGKGRVLAVTWVKPFMIPQRYYARFTDSWIEARVIDQNRSNFINSMKNQVEKAEELKNRL